MKTYLMKDMRNVCILGHGGSGKTSLAESMLFLGNGTDRLGKVSDGNTISDYEAEEIKRNSLATAKASRIEILKNATMQAEEEYASAISKATEQANKLVNDLSCEIEKVANELVKGVIDGSC